MKFPASLNRRVSASVLVFMTLYSMGAAQETPKPGPEHKRLDGLVGEWEYDGRQHATPLGPSDTYKGREVSRLILGGFFLESRSQDTGEAGGSFEGIRILGYDAQKREYVSHVFENSGRMGSATVTVDGNTWTGVGERTDSQGKTCKIRSSFSLAPDGNSGTAKGEYSEDGGRTWRVWWEENFRKTATAPAASAGSTRAAIVTLNKAYQDAFNRGDAEAIARLYAEDAVTLRGNAGFVRGREAILKLEKEAMGTGDTRQTYETLEVEEHDDMAHEIGTWISKDRDGKVLGQGHYFCLWKRVNGEWKIHREAVTERPPAEGAKP
jgi:uncharacterized protein (TIGR02246 family)